MNINWAKIFFINVFLKKNMQNQFGRNLESIDGAKVTPYTEVLFYDKGIVLFYDKMYYSFVFLL